MKIRNVLLIGIFTFFILIGVVNAEDRTCNYTNKANAKKIASKVSASYEIKYENGVPYFEISVYNVTDDIVISVASDKDGAETKFIMYYMTTDGVYTFKNYDIDTIENYKIEISSTKYDCGASLRTVKFVKPKRNAVHDDPECSYPSTVNSYYCQEWITKKFPYSYQTLINKIKEQRLRDEAKTSTTKAQVKTRRKTFYEKIKGVTLYIIIGLLIAILIDGILIIIDLIKMRKEKEL